MPFMRALASGSWRLLNGSSNGSKTEACILTDCGSECVTPWPMMAPEKCALSRTVSKASVRELAERLTPANAEAIRRQLLELAEGG